MPSTTTPKATAASSTDRTADRNEKPMTTASATASLESLRRGAQKLGGILLGVFLLFAVYASIMSLLFSEPAAGAYEHPTFGLIEFRSNGLGAWQRPGEPEVLVLWSSRAGGPISFAFSRNRCENLPNQGSNAVTGLLFFVSHKEMPKLARRPGRITQRELNSIASP